MNRFNKQWRCFLYFYCVSIGKCIALECNFVYALIEWEHTHRSGICIQVKNHLSQSHTHTNKAHTHIQQRMCHCSHERAQSAAIIHSFSFETFKLNACECIFILHRAALLTKQINDITFMLYYVSLRFSHINNGVTHLNTYTLISKSYVCVYIVNSSPEKQVVKKRHIKSKRS